MVSTSINFITTHSKNLVLGALVSFAVAQPSTAMVPASSKDEKTAEACIHHLKNKLKLKGKTKTAHEWFILDALSQVRTDPECGNLIQATPWYGIAKQELGKIGDQNNIKLIDVTPHYIILKKEPGPHDTRMLQPHTAYYIYGHPSFELKERAIEASLAHQEGAAAV